MESHQDAFDRQLISLLPRLRVQALALTRNPSAASDLVQDAVMNALRARDSFTPGTNFAAWMHRILRNRFISDTRKRRPSVDIDDVPEAALATPAAHEDRLVLKALHRATARLPLLQRESLFMVVLQGMSYEQVAEATGCAVGTAKSRVFRARRQLQLWLAGETPPAAEHRQTWPEGVEADAPARLAEGGALPTRTAFATRPGLGTPGARRTQAMRVAGDASC